MDSFERNIKSQYGEIVLCERKKINKGVFRSIESISFEEKEPISIKSYETRKKKESMRTIGANERISF